jgi:Holliday junction resolvase RusA-like endonuclease
MTKSDRWKINPNHIDPRKRQRPAVTRYFDFKNKVVKECNKVGYVMKNHIDVVFFLPMPDSWSTKKKELYNGKPHKSRPDIDNIVKGLMDAVKKEDGDVWSVKAEKRYAYKGSILIYE